MKFLLPPTAIHEFPEDIFTKEQRKKGAVCLHALCVSISHNIAWKFFFLMSLTHDTDIWHHYKQEPTCL